MIREDVIKRLDSGDKDFFGENLCGFDLRGSIRGSDLRDADLIDAVLASMVWRDFGAEVRRDNSYEHKPTA